MQNVGVVVIGRNEGERLERCIGSILNEIDEAERIVYVDSGSTDNSVTFCREIGVTVLELDPSENFTAALARNRGYKEFVERFPECDLIQFIDGDCSLSPGWLSSASQRLFDNPTLAIVCGRRAELYPEASIYNRLCDIEWDTPIGMTHACGGDSMMRCKAFSAVGGFDAQMIAGEEPELCYRLRQQGWLIERLDMAMTAHDAAIHQFSQWARRASRSGSAYAWGAFLHGRSDEKYNVREVVSILVWGAVLPLTILIFSLAFGAIILSASILYPIMLFRITNKHTAQLGVDLASKYAFFIMVAKFYQCYGIAAFCLRKLLKKEHTLIEYK